MSVGEDTASSSLGGLEPKVKWQTAGNVGGFDVEVRYGALTFPS